MRNYYQIKTVASAPPRKLIPIGKVFSATGLVLAIVGLFSALSSSANIFGSLSFPFLLFGLFFFCRRAPSCYYGIKATRETTGDTPIAPRR